MSAGWWIWAFRAGAGEVDATGRSTLASSSSEEPAVSKRRTLFALSTLIAVIAFSLMAFAAPRTSSAAAMAAAVQPLLAGGAVARDQLAAFEDIHRELNRGFGECAAGALAALVAARRGGADNG